MRFNLVIFVIISFLAYSISCQSSYFYKKIPVVHLEDDIVDVFELTEEDSRPHHVLQHRRHNPVHDPEVNRIISNLHNVLRPSESRGDWEDNSHYRRPHHRSLKRRRNFHSRLTQRWPQGVIPFVIDRSLWRIKRLIHNAMREIESHSCIRFKDRDDEDNFVLIRYGSGCFSSVGMKGGQQTLSLGRGCASFGIVLHELMHVVGFYHLHQRHDRDKFLDIHWDNIDPLYINNFKLLGPEHIPVDEKFDYHSIMMYGETSFSKDSDSITMTPTFNGVRLLDPAYKTSLSEIDVRSMRRMYDCDSNDINHNLIDYDDE